MFDEIPHELNGITEVQKIYSWDGSVTSYKAGNMFIPVAIGNRHYVAIKKLAESGQLILKEPEIKEVTKAYNFEGVLKGYTCGCGFVPIDDSNALFKLIIKDIDNGKCIVKEPEEVKFAWGGNGQIDHVKLYYIPEAVMHIDTGILEGEIEYTINGFIEGESYKYKVENINLATGDYRYHLTKKIQGEPAIAHLFDQIEYTLMEIELPVKQLARAFKNHQSFEFSKSYCSYLDMFYNQYVAQYGKDVPDLAWLLLHAPSYLYKVFFLEIFFNRLIGNYNDYQQEKKGYIL